MEPKDKLQLAPRLPCLQSESALLEGILVLTHREHPAPPYELLREAVLAERGEQRRLFPGYSGYRLEVTKRERELIDAVVDHVEPSLRGMHSALVSYGSAVRDVLLERLECVTEHPDFATLGYRFLTLPWRRQLIVLERIGLLRDQDEPLTGKPLFHVSFKRALERGALRHFKILVDNERDQVGLENKTAAPPDVIPNAAAPGGSYTKE